MNREAMLDTAGSHTGSWDIIIVGGGATGVGVAVDAASRGYDVLLLEQSDFGKGTSSRSTKLIHGGVRYLQQGNLPLVLEALRERGILRRNAPHLVHDLPFVVPNYSWWEAPFYGIGMKVYDALAGQYGFGASKHLSLEETIDRIPTIETEGLHGGVIYHDGQFDDARLLVTMVQTAVEQGATVLSYARVTGLLKCEGGFVEGVAVRDEESGCEMEIRAKVVVNATGVFTDDLRRVDDPGAGSVIRPSQGVHLVLGRHFLPEDSAIMVPRTEDGRVLFAIPWYHCVIVGTTDTPVDRVSLEPVALEEEVDFILRHAARYLTQDPTPDDVLSVFAGLRPLVGSPDSEDTSHLSREHAVLISRSGLLTIAGGKWTTYRKMAEDVMDHAIVIGGLDPQPCVTKELRIHGFHLHADRFGELAHYGSDAPEIQRLLDSDPGLGERIHPRLPARRGEVAWAVREEMCRTVDDFLARRTRSLLFDARAAVEAASDVAALMAEELGVDERWQDAQVSAFKEIARGYVVG